MISNTKKARALHRVYTLIRHLDPQASIQRDSLHAVYQVNKFGIRVRFDQQRLSDLKNNFIRRYCQELGLQPSPDGFYKSDKTGLVLSINEQDMRYFNQEWTAVDITLY